MKIGVIGTGYVGLVTGAGFAEMGNTVICMDVDQSKIDQLNKNIPPIYEPGLKELLTRNSKMNRLLYTTTIDEAVNNSDLIFIAVGTPSDTNGKADLKYVVDVAKSIGQTMNSKKIVVTKSTVPVGTSKMVRESIQEQLTNRGLDLSFDVVSNPEFLKEGSAINDFLRPDRVIVGCDSENAKTIMQRLYSPFVKNGHPIHYMDIASAEMTKYAANAMLATKISFANEISRLCEDVGADMTSVRRGIGSDKRIGLDFIYAGLGYGGSCFPKDVKALLNTGLANDRKMHLLTAVEKINQDQREWFTKKIIDFYDSNLEGKTFGLWGLAFKPGTDDMREAPSLYLIEKLTALGAKIVAYDPVAMDNTKSILENTKSVTYADNPYRAIEGTDALILATEWREFREPDFDKMKNLLKSPTIFDGRNQYDLEELEQKGYKYISIGRRKVG